MLTTGVGGTEAPGDREQSRVRGDTEIKARSGVKQGGGKKLSTTGRDSPSEESGARGHRQTGQRPDTTGPGRDFGLKKTQG